MYWANCMLQTCIFSAYALTIWVKVWGEICNYSARKIYIFKVVSDKNNNNNNNWMQDKNVI